MAVELRLLFADGEDTPADDRFEVWELEEERFRPIDLVEEALIMALPLSAMHDNSEACRTVDEKPSDEDEMTRPFAALKSQMEQDD